MLERRRRQAKGPPQARGRKRTAASRKRRPSVPRANGFSLLELIAVIAVIGLALAVVFPRLQGLEDRYLDSDAQRLSLLAVFLGEKASATRHYYRMRFDLKGAAITVESSADGVEYAPVAEAVSRGLKLRRGVEIDEVSAPGLGKVRRGEAAIALSPTGGPPFEVTLVSGKRKALVSYNPFTGRASVTDPDKKVSDG